MAKNKNTEFADYIFSDLLEGLPNISKRAMFGGYSFYYKKKIFGCIFEGEFYLKVSPEDIKEYEKYGSKPFVYTYPSGRKIIMPYYSLPEEAFENRELFLEFFEKSVKIKK